jgi:ABC-type multidrug transport system fused ATPase/permease subunit
MSYILITDITSLLYKPELLSGSYFSTILHSSRLLSGIGTLRRNLDPFEQHGDAILNDALHAAGLFSLQEGLEEAPLTLDSNIASGGGNLSVGQRQVLALARAIVRGS